MHGLSSILLVVLAVILALAGCGSGGGSVRPDSTVSDGTQLPPPPPPPPPSPARCIPTHSRDCRSPADFESFTTPLAERFRDEESFKNQWGLDAIGADWAYAHLEVLEGEDEKPGSGVTIGFIDTGIDQDHPMFEGKTLNEVFLFGASDETVAGFDTDGFSHGTAVASIALGRPTNLAHAPQGVAWSADVTMFALPVGSGGGLYNPVSFTSLANRDSVLEGWLETVLGGGYSIDILNLSIGFDGIIDEYSEQDLRDNLGQTIAKLAQAGATEKTVVVWAAGNAQGDPCTASPTNPHCANEKIDAVSVEVLPGLAARIPELRGHSIAVVALKKGTSGPEIADFSNRCGIAADYCIAAPGEDVRFAYFGDQGRGTAQWHGTSFAAPMVAGGLAIMKQLFRDQLSNTALTARLLSTADNTGRLADRTVYGRGLMDLRAATSPVGVLDVPMSSLSEGSGTALQRTAVQTGAALGDGLELSFAGREIMALDALGAPFWFKLDDFAGATAMPSARARLRDLMASVPGALHAPGHGIGFRSGELRTQRHARSDGWQFGLLQAPEGAESGHLGLAGRALALTWADQRALSGTAFTTGGEFDPAPASGASFSWQPAGSPLGLHAGWVGERESLLGSSADGAFGALAADAVFAGIRAHANLGGWQLGANAELGTVDSATRGGLITDVSALTTSAFALHASKPLAGDGTLRFSVSQPLRVEHGRASLAVPTGRTKAGAVVRNAVRADLEPSGRQIDIAAHRHQPLAVGELRLGALVTLQPGHRASENPEFTVLSGWRLTF